MPANASAYAVFLAAIRAQCALTRRAAPVRRRRLSLLLIAALRRVAGAFVRGVILPALLRLPARLLSERAGAVDLLFHILKRAFILLVLRLEINGEFELLFALVQPIFLVEDDGLIVVPLAAAVVHIVQKRLRLGEIPCRDRGFDVLIAALFAVRIAAHLRSLVGAAHRLLIGVVQHFEHACGIRARLAFVKDVLLIVGAFLLVRVEDLALRCALFHTEDHKRVTWHLSSPLSNLSICI